MNTAFHIKFYIRMQTVYSRVIAEAVSRWFLTAAARVRAQVWQVRFVA
jgi:hypothetical protein